MQTYTVDTDRSRLSFAVPGLLRTRGAFTRVAGTATVDEQGTPQSLEISIDARSLRTGLAARDLHLRTAGFLNVRRYPMIAYSGERFEQVGPDRYTVGGTLRLHGREHPVALEVTLAPDVGPDGASQASVNAVLRRTAFGIPRNPLLRALLRPIIGDTVAVTADVRAALGRETAATSFAVG